MYKFTMNVRKICLKSFVDYIPIPKDKCTFQCLLFKFRRTREILSFSIWRLQTLTGTRYVVNYYKWYVILSSNCQPHWRKMTQEKNK